MNGDEELDIQDLSVVDHAVEILDVIVSKEVEHSQLTLGGVSPNFFFSGPQQL